MLRRTLTIFTLAAAVIGCQAAIARSPVTAVTALMQKEKGQKDKGKDKASMKHSLKHEMKAEMKKAEMKSEAKHEPKAGGGRQTTTTMEQTGRASLTVERGGKVVVGTLQGRIVITGAQGNTIDARATSSAGSEPVPLRVTREEGRSRVSLSVPPTSDALLEIKVPRYMEVEVVGGHREADVEVSDLDAAVNIGSGNGRVIAHRVGPLRVNRTDGDIIASDVKGDLVARAISGDIKGQNIEGLADMLATSGDVIVHNTGGDVRVTSASGDIEVHCVKGRVDLNTASGDIGLVGVGGDIDANTASGDVDYRGRIRANGRYVLKSHSGEVRAVIQPDAPGFTATLTSYNGEIETSFPLKLDSTLQGRVTNRRVTGRFGDGQAQLQLDSFSGGVRILKGAAEPAAECK
jgi:hypothetical protein